MATFKPNRTYRLKNQVKFVLETKGKLQISSGTTLSKTEITKLERLELLSGNALNLVLLKFLWFGKELKH